MAQLLVKQDVWIQITQQRDSHVTKYAMNYWAVVSIGVSSPVMRVCVLLVKCRKCNHVIADAMRELLVVVVVSRCSYGAILDTIAVRKSVMRKYNLSLERRIWYS